MYIWFNVGMFSKNGVFMGGMRNIIRALAALVFFCTVNSFADDIMATASNGATVILHDNGRWEYYQNNSKIRDIRQSAIPEDAKFNIMVEYEDPERVRKNVRLSMEADFATEEEIKDSLRKVPKGGYIYFQVKTAQIKKGIPIRTRLPGNAAGATAGTPEVRPSRSSRTKDSFPQVSNAHTG